MTHTSTNRSLTAVIILTGLAIGVTPRGDAEGAAPATNAVVASKTSAAASKAPTSAGLLNDWLRGESKAWSPWDLGGQFRARFESFDNITPAFPTRDFQRNVANDDRYLWLRERAHIGYTAPWFNVYAEGQICTSSGDFDPKNPGQDRWDLHQGYLTLGNLKEFPFTVKVGRQELIYGDERLVGASDWSNPGRSFDAVKLHYENPTLWVDGFVGRVVLINDNKFDEPDMHDWFSGVYASTKTLIPFQETQVYALSRNVSAGSLAGTAARDIYSFGFRVKSLPNKLKGWDYSAEVVEQAGSIAQGGKRLKQKAYAAALTGGYTWSKVFASPRLGIEYDYSTGDRDPNDGKSETLDNLFPTNHKHYGLMDAIGWRNIHDLRFASSFKPIKDLSVALDYHLFWLANTHDFFYPQSGSGRNGAGYGRNSNFQSFVGSEIDLEATYAVTSWAGLRAGCGHFFPGGYVDSSKAGLSGAVGASWFYLSGTLNF